MPAVRRDPPLVSVVIPARDAADTIPDALRSLADQTCTGWEAVVVDDDSTDGTAEAVAGVAGADGRVVLTGSDGRGVSAARNTGLARARGDWLLFLDADDSLEPGALDVLLSAARVGAGSSVAVGGWTRVGPSDEDLSAFAWDDDPGDAFDALCRYCTFAIHSVLVRRELVEAVGGFDVSLRTCEDWDLWQRIARAGAGFVRVPQFVARYRARPGAASNDWRRLLEDGFEVIARGHAPDPRVPAPDDRYAGGRPEYLRPAALLEFAAWPAAVAVACGEPVGAVIAEIERRYPSEVSSLDPDPVRISDGLFEAPPFVGGEPRAAWSVMWDELHTPLSAFADAVERLAGSPGLAERVRLRLARRVALAAGRPGSFGRVRVELLDLTEDLGDIVVRDEMVDRVVCVATHQDVELGPLELPACDGRVHGAVLRDALAARWFWDIVRRHLTRRGAVPAGAADADLWQAFVDDLWGPLDGDPSTSVRRSTDGAVVLEVSHPLPDLASPGPSAEVVLEVGGAPVERVVLAPEEFVDGPHVAAAVVNLLRAELCRVAVREALIGRSPEGVSSIREALTARAGAERRPPVEPLVRVGRRRWGLPGTSASRRAVLPRAAADVSTALAVAAGETLERREGPGGVEYAPDVLRRTHRATARRPREQAPAFTYDRHEFERLFASASDPWRYTGPYEQRKYEQTLSLVPSGVSRVLEVGCAEGHFTVALADHAREVVAVDVAQVAIERARARCAGRDNVRFIRADLFSDRLPGGFDAVVCSEVLYYAGDLARLRRAAAALAKALVPGGHLVCAHANLLVDDPTSDGFDWDLPFGAKMIGDVLARTPGLALTRELRTSPYRIQVFRRAGRLHGFARRRPVEIVEASASDELPELAGTFVRGGSRPTRTHRMPPLRSERLPILMYHRIADDGPAALSRWRVGTRAFEEQLVYLAEAGFRSVSLDDWHIAVHEREPMAGRPILLTFDDGYRDFASTAWPLLRRYGFAATMFVVTDAVGGTSTWDARAGDPAPLLAWDEIASLAADGVTIGSHSATHRALSALSTTDVVDELARSRLTLLERGHAPATAFAAPYGDRDGAIDHLAGACGYLSGLGCRGGAAGFDDPLLDLPRIEITGHDTLTSFVAKLGI